MQQPKFKFGDKVYEKNGLAFEVRSIVWSEYYSEFEYNGDCLESAVKLYQGPQKKKLYAYWYLVGQYRSVTLFENLITDNCLTYSHFHRCEEYDIEYPETKVD